MKVIDIFVIWSNGCDGEIYATVVDIFNDITKKADVKIKTNSTRFVIFNASIYGRHYI